MTQILALQGLESELGSAAYTTTTYSHWSSEAHMRVEQPVADEAVR